MQNVDGSRARHTSAGLLLSLSALGAFILMGSGCSSSDSEVKPDGGAATGGTQNPGSGGQTGSTGGSGRAGSGGSSGGTGGGSSGGTGGNSSGGAMGTGGSTGGATGTGGSAGGCPARSKFTQAVHEVLNVTWPAGTATSAGTGTVHFWAKTLFTANGNSLTGSLQVCGTVLPPAELSALVGGGMVLIEFPPAAWESSGAPHFDLTATLSGWNVGDTFTYTYTALVGFTMADGSTAAWPATYTGITTPADFDGDTIPGLTSVPRNGGGYVLPPTSIVGALGHGAGADKVYVANRNVATVTQKWTSCDEGAGTEEFKYFNNHVIGCHVMGASECTAAETKFVDDNRTIFSVTSATSKTTIVPDAATCADVRNALPM